MEDNWFTAYPSNIHDLTVTAKTRDVKVWLDKEDVGLELSFRRISMDELDKMITADGERGDSRARKTRQQYKGMLPEDLDELLAMFASGQSKGYVGTEVERWVKDDFKS